MSDLPDMEVVAADLRRQDSEEDPIVFELSAYVAFSLIAQLQLAIRHPANFGGSAEVATKFVNELAEHLPESAQAVIRAGWNPENDE